MSSPAELRAMLPWAHPFVMVDRVHSCVPHERAVTSKQVTGDDPVMPVTDSGELFFPSVLILEGLSQTAALLFRLSYGPQALSGAPLLGYLKASISGSASPGDTLVFTVTALKMTSRNGVFSGVAAVGATEVASAELAFAVGAP
jgi:3-hydroxymyristoyl/3-hydroxydecanoyl-(acyl carrier protein) dehydratase